MFPRRTIVPGVRSPPDATQARTPQTSRRAKRVRPPARPRIREEPVVTRARIAAAGESLKILSGPPTARGTIELARSINELTDRSIARVHAACQDGHRVACRSGCTYCCMFPVAASAPEVLAIAAFVRERFDEERRAALDARIEAGHCTVYEVRPVACRGYS